MCIEVTEGRHRHSISTVVVFMADSFFGCWKTVEVEARNNHHSLEVPMFDRVQAEWTGGGEQSKRARGPWKSASGTVEVR
jgi:hypothetical protein